jgi:hypothetical protein
MSTILGLALKVTGDASGLAKSLDPVDKALANIGKQVDRATAVFTPFTAASAAAARAQESFVERFAKLSEQLQSDIVKPQEYAAAFAQLTEEAQKAADVFERGAETTSRFSTEQEKNVGRITLLVEELRAGAIEAPTFERALAGLAGVDLSSSEDAARFIAILAQNARDGSIDIERAAASLLQLSDAQKQTADSQQSLAASSRQSNLQLSELSGMLSLLPGNLGAVSARISGLSGAVQGFEKISAGGITRAVDTLGSSFGALATPVGIGVAAIAGFGAATAAIVAGLRNLEGRVESLGFAAQQAGTDFQTIQVLDEAARRTGTSVDALASGVQKFAVTIDEARSGSGKAAEAFRELGISQDALANSTPVQLAEQTAEALAKIEDPARRSALQVELLGKSGETLRRGFSAFTEAEEALARFGATLIRSDFDQIATLGSAFDDLQTSLAGLSLNTLKPFIDAVASGTSALAEFFGTASRVFGGLLRLAQPFIDGFADGLKIIGFAFEQLNDGIDFVFRTAEKTNGAVGAVRREAEKPLDRGLARDLERSLQSVNDQLSRASLESEKFGVAGSRAFAEYQRTAEGLQRQFSSKIIDEAAFARGIERANEAYRQQIDLARRTAEEVNRKVEADRAAADALIEQQRIQRDFNGDAQRAEAADKVLNVEREIARVQQEIAMVNPFSAAAKAGEERILQLQKIGAEQQRIADGSDQAEQAITARVDALLKSTEQRTEEEQRILDITAEKKRLEEEINLATIERREEDRLAAVARLAQVDQYEAKLREQQQIASQLADEVDQGFTDGYAKAFEQTNQSIQGLIGRAQEFGNVGALAFDALRAGVERAQKQAEGGILTAATYEREVAQQKELFEQRIDAARRVENFFVGLIDERQKAEMDAIKQREDREKQAKINVQELEAKIEEEKTKRDSLKNLGDRRAATTRIKELERAQRTEKAIAEGRVQANRQQAQQLQQGQTAAQQFQSLIARQNDAFLKGFQDAYAGANNALAQGARVAEEQARRLEMLRPTNATVNVADIRTAEGQALVQSVAEQAQDPALIEARQQTRLLNAIAQGITGAASNYFNQPVAIVGAARL